MAEPAAPTINGELALLIEQFNLAIRTPDDAAQLKQLILQLAVMGKLVPQDPDDEPAAVLIQHTQNLRTQMIKSGQIRGKKGLEVVDHTDAPSIVPKSWIWVRLGEMTEYIGSGSTPRGGKQVYQSDGIKFLRSQNVWNDGLYLDDVAYISQAVNSRMQRTVVRPRDILLNITGASIGRSALVPDDFDDANVSQHVSIIRLIDLRLRHYFHKLIISSRFQEAIMDVQVGISRAGLSKKRLSEFAVPVPPLAEQHRIVAKVDELMAAADELSGRLAAAGRQRERFHTAALHQLTTAETPARTAAAWSLLDGRFDALYDDPAAVDELKQAILQLAVMGRLVPQDPDDEPAAVLLERIAAEKKLLVKKGLIPKLRKSTPVDEASFSIPTGWVWCRWSDVSMQIGDVDHKMPTAVESGIPYVSPRDFTPNNGIDFSNAKKITPEDYARLSSKIRPEVGDIIFPRYGTIGVNRLVDDDRAFLASYSCAIVKHMPALMNPRYVFSYSTSGLVAEEIARYTNKTTQPNVGVKSIANFQFPLPPLAEQHRIVAKVDELFALADEVAARAGAAEAARGRLLAALVGRGVG